MIFRLSSVAIVLFWLGTTGWLVRTVWFTDEDRFEPIGTEEVLGAFFRWNDTTNLTILENGVKIGQMALGGLEGEDPRTGAVVRGLSSSGTLDEPEMDSTGSANLSGLTWRLNANFAESSDLNDFETVIRVPKQNLNIRLEWKGEPPVLAARAMIGGVTIYESGQLSVNEADDRGAAAMVENSPAVAAAKAGAFPLPGLGGGGPGGLADASTWAPRIEASKGMMDAAGRGLPVYLLKIRFGNADLGEPLRLYLSEAGEPLRIDTGWGFEAVAEVLIPVETNTP